MKLTREDAEKEFNEHNIRIPEELWVDVWPKKVSVKKANKKTFTPKVTVSDSEDDKDNSNILKLQTIEVEGQRFLLSEDNIVYDIDTEDEIGLFEDGNVVLN